MSFFFCNQKANILTVLVLTDDRFIGTICRVLNYARTFQLKYGVRFADAKNTTIATDMLAPEFLPRAHLATYRRIVRAAKFFQLHSEAFAFATWEAAPSIGNTHVDISGLRMATKEFAMQLRQSDEHYVTSPQRPKGDFPAGQFSRAAVRFLNTIGSLILSIWAAESDTFPNNGLAHFVAAELQLTRR